MNLVVLGCEFDHLNNSKGSSDKARTARRRVALTNPILAVEGGRTVTPVNPSGGLESEIARF